MSNQYLSNILHQEKTNAMPLILIERSLQIEYHKVASSNMTHVPQAGLFRLLMKGIFDPYVL